MRTSAKSGKIAKQLPKHLDSDYDAHNDINLAKLRDYGNDNSA